MNVSLDLLIKHAVDEQGGGSWMHIGEQLHREFNARAREMTLSVEGRKIYETMEEYWPAARTDESLPDYLRECGEIWTSTPKILVTRTRTSAEHGTPNHRRRQRDRRAREGPGRGRRSATQLLRAGLLDELLLLPIPSSWGQVGH